MAFNRRKFLLSLAAAGGLVSSLKPGLASTSFSPAPLQGGIQPGDWPFSTSELRGTRSNPHESIIGPGNVGRLKVKWTFDGAQSFNQTTPSVVGNSVYFPANDGHVYAVDARSGALRWKFNAREGIQPNQPGIFQKEINADPVGQMRGSVAYGHGRIFVGDGTARMHCLDASSGEEIWRTSHGPAGGNPPQ